MVQIPFLSLLERISSVASPLSTLRGEERLLQPTVREFGAPLDAKVIDEQEEKRKEEARAMVKQMLV